MIRWAIGLAVLLMDTGFVHAQTLSTSGRVLIISPPESVGADMLQNNVFAYIFEEQQSITLSTPILLDIAVAGTYERDTIRTPRVILEGASVRSYFVHYEPFTANQQVGFSVRSSERILGFIVVASSLFATDDQLGSPFTSYENTGGVREFLDTVPDTLIFDSNERDAEFTLHIINARDQLRIITSTCLADLTTQGTSVGDLSYAMPDGLITAADINYYVGEWVADSPAADMTTQGAPIGSMEHGVPDGLVSGADIQFYVNLWIAGCP